MFFAITSFSILLCFKLLSFISDSGEFEEPFSGFDWKIEASDSELDIEEIQALKDYIKKIHLTILWGPESEYSYDMVFYQFAPAT